VTAARLLGVDLEKAYLEKLAKNEKRFKRRKELGLPDLLKIWVYMPWLASSPLRGLGCRHASVAAEPIAAEVSGG
jgi:predicted nucleotide-binding protein (sugar kinase/HSP70/actin superfamily)